MKYYRLSFNRPIESVEEGPGWSETETVWVGTQREAAQQRADWTRRGIKQAEITTEEIDVPTDRKGLLEFIRRSGAR